jgi:aminoglycoside phosphotransferase (APT) family kinase protein
MSPDEVRGLVAASLPNYAAEAVVLLGEGTDNLAYEVNGELVVRIAKEPAPGLVDRESRLLGAVAEICPLPVPSPVFTVPESGCLACFKVPGVPLLDLPELTTRTTIPVALGELLTSLHAVPVDRLAGLVEPDNFPLSEWLEEAAENFEGVATQVPAEYHEAIACFLASPLPATEFELVFSHNDLGIEHVLVEPSTGAVTGIIDWGDAALVDPAYDFGFIYRDLGPEALKVALSHYPSGGIEQRAIFYARCSVFEDLSYGLDAGDDRYVQKSLRSLAWLYGSPASRPRLSP